VVVVALVVSVLSALGAGAEPQESPESPESPLGSGGAETAQSSEAAVTVIVLSGRLDPIMSDFITSNIEAAEVRDDIAVVIQVNSPGSVISDAEFLELARLIRDTSVPTAAWVGPTGARARGGVAQLLALVDDVGIAPGAKLGDMGDLKLPADEFGELWPGTDGRLLTETISRGDVSLIDASDEPTLPAFVATLDGVETETPDEGEARPVATTRVRSVGLSLGARLMHTVASPEVTYLLVVTGLGLLIFEFFTAGVGVAGIVGAGSLVLGSYGLWVLPTRWWAIALFLFSMVAFSIDIQTGVPRFWTAVGGIAFLIASLFIYSDGVPLSWITLLVGLAGMAFTMLSGMPTMVRTRFSTPTIGREWMVGELGRSVAAVDPDGTVEVAGALWRARTNRATPIGAEETIRVIGIDRLVLEVEPEEGGARDYRERGKSDDPVESESDAAAGE
jgi:membrane-bound serine protease (ClpP class)